MGGLFDSKTNKQILIGVGISVALICLGIAVEVITDKSVFDYIALGVAKVFGDTSLATYRNVRTDAPIRQQEAALEVAIKAKEADVALPSVGPIHWTPPSANGGSK